MRLKVEPYLRNNHLHYRQIGMKKIVKVTHSLKTAKMLGKQKKIWEHHQYVGITAVTTSTRCKLW